MAGVGSDDLVMSGQSRDALLASIVEMCSPSATERTVGPEIPLVNRSEWKAVCDEMHQVQPVQPQFEGLEVTSSAVGEEGGPAAADPIRREDSLQCLDLAQSCRFRLWRLRRSEEVSAEEWAAAAEVAQPEVDDAERWELQKEKDMAVTLAQLDAVKAKHRLWLLDEAERKKECEEFTGTPRCAPGSAGPWMQRQIERLERKVLEITNRVRPSSLAGGEYVEKFKELIKKTPYVSPHILVRFVAIPRTLMLSGEEEGTRLYPRHLPCMPVVTSVVEVTAHEFAQTASRWTGWIEMLGGADTPLRVSTLVLEALRLGQVSLCVTSDRHIVLASRCALWNAVIMAPSFQQAAAVVRTQLADVEQEWAPHCRDWAAKVVRKTVDRADRQTQRTVAPGAPRQVQTAGVATLTNPPTQPISGVPPPELAAGQVATAQQLLTHSARECYEITGVMVAPTVRLEFRELIAQMAAQGKETRPFIDVTVGGIPRSSDEQVAKAAADRVNNGPLGPLTKSGMTVLRLLSWFDNWAVESVPPQLARRALLLSCASSVVAEIQHVFCYAHGWNARHCENAALCVLLKELAVTYPLLTLQRQLSIPTPAKCRPSKMLAYFNWIGKALTRLREVDGMGTAQLEEPVWYFQECLFHLADWAREHLTKEYGLRPINPPSVTDLRLFLELKLVPLEQRETLVGVRDESFSVLIGKFGLYAALVGTAPDMTSAATNAIQAASPPWRAPNPVSTPSPLDRRVANVSVSSSTPRGRSERQDIVCFACGQQGHFARNCPERTLKREGSGAVLQGGSQETKRHRPLAMPSSVQIATTTTPTTTATPPRMAGLAPKKKTKRGRRGGAKIAAARAAAQLRTKGEPGSGANTTPIGRAAAIISSSSASSASSCIPAVEPPSHLEQVSPFYCAALAASSADQQSIFAISSVREARILVDGMSLLAMIDTGASFNGVARHVVNEAPNAIRSRRSIRVTASDINNQPCSYTEGVTLVVLWAGHEVVLDCVVMDNPCAPLIMGAGFLNKCVIDNPGNVLRRRTGRGREVIHLPLIPLNTHTLTTNVDDIVPPNSQKVVALMPPSDVESVTLGTTVMAAPQFESGVDGLHIGAALTDTVNPVVTVCNTSSVPVPIPSGSFYCQLTPVSEIKSVTSIGTSSHVGGGITEKECDRKFRKFLVSQHMASTQKKQSRRTRKQRMRHYLGAVKAQVAREADSRPRGLFHDATFGNYRKHLEATGLQKYPDLSPEMLETAKLSHCHMLRALLELFHRLMRKGKISGEYVSNLASVWQRRFGWVKPRGRYPVNPELVKPNRGVRETMDHISAACRTAKEAEDTAQLTTPQEAPFDPDREVTETEAVEFERELPADLDLSQARKELTRPEFRKLLAVLHKHRDIFSGLPGTITGATCEIETEGPPIYFKPRRESPQEQVLVKNEVEAYLKKNIIRPSRSPWASPIVLVAKKDGTCRFCIDFRKLNTVTKRDVYPIPRQDSLLEHFEGMKYFTTLDLTSGYWQIPVHPDSIEKTAFTCSQGLYEWLRMPFGLVNAPSIFQRTMDVVLAGLKWTMCLVYIDDVIIFALTLPEHLKRLDIVLTRLVSHGVKLRASKCTFIAAEVPYLGHLISRKGIRVDPAKVRALKQLPKPTNVKDVRTFLGLSGYYRRFVRNYAQRTSLIRELVKEHVPFQWTDREEGQRQDVIQAIEESAVMPHPDFAKTFLVDTDASYDGLGAVLSQVVDGIERPIQFLSRALSSDEQKRSASELEALAVMWALERLRPYVNGLPFEVRTDNAALTWVKSAQKGRLARWALKLSEFDYTVHHRAGRVHSNADCLSRHPVDPPTDGRDDLMPDRAFPPIEMDKTDEEQTRVGACRARMAFISVMAASPIADRATATVHPILPNPTAIKPLEATEGAVTMKEIRERQLTDEFCKFWHTALRLKQAKAHKLFLMNNEVLLRHFSDGHAVPVVPEALRRKVISHYHEQFAHPGTERTLRLVGRRFWWPRMRREIARWVSGCETCLDRKRKAGHQMPRVPFCPSRPMDVIAADVKELPVTRSGNKYLLVMIDHFTKWPELFAMDVVTSARVVLCLKSFMSRHGVPSALLTDNASIFRAAVLGACAALGINKLFSAAYHPQGNSIVERVNRTIGTVLRTLCDQTRYQWDEVLSELAWVLRCCYHESIGGSPYWALYGREPTAPSDLAMLEDETSPTSVTQHVETIHLLQTEVAATLANKAIERTERDRLRLRLSSQPLAVGDTVRLQLTPAQRRRFKKLYGPHWGADCVVVAVKASGVSFSIRNSEGKQLVVHGSRLQKVHRDAMDVVPPELIDGSGGIERSTQTVDWTSMETGREVSTSVHDTPVQLHQASQSESLRALSVPVTDALPSAPVVDETGKRPNELRSAYVKPPLTVGQYVDVNLPSSQLFPVAHEEVQPEEESECEMEDITNDDFSQWAVDSCHEPREIDDLECWVEVEAPGESEKEDEADPEEEDRYSDSDSSMEEAALHTDKSWHPSDTDVDADADMN